MEFLLSKGASTSALRPNKTTPLREAIRGGHPVVADILIQKGADINCGVLLACKTVDMAAYVLSQKGIDINAKWNGKAGLHVACANSNFEMIRFLVEKGADINLVADDQETPLSLVGIWRDDDEDDKNDIVVNKKTQWEHAMDNFFFFCISIFCISRSSHS